MMHLAPRAASIRRAKQVRIFVVLEVFTDAADAQDETWGSTGEDAADIVWRGDGVEMERAPVVRRRGALEAFVMHILFWWVDGLPGASIVVCDHALQLCFGRLASVHLARVGNVVGETDAIDPHELFKVDVTNVGSVRILETLDEECAIRIGDEEGANPTRRMRLYVNSEGVSSALNNCVRVLDKLRATPMREVCFSPGLRVD